ncbi:MAG: fibronectin type III domain-containing protein [Eubacterium sp.]|nr:fibronectin type III domain-containing protein [Eubacterium sp.]
MKKSLSVILAVLMCLSCMSFSVSADAAQAKTVSVTLKGTQYASIIQEAMNGINAKRANYGYEKIYIDDALTATAQRRAAEIMLYYDVTNDTRPDGSPITSLVSGYGNYSDTIFNTLYNPDAENVESALDSLAYGFSGIRSIGIGVFGYKDTYTIYAIISTKEVFGTPDFSDNVKSYKVNVALSKFKEKRINYTSKNNGRYYVLSTKFYAGGYYRDYVTIPNSQLTYQSSNSKIFKIKNYNGYFKKNGKFTITSKLKNGGNVICKDTRNLSSYSTIRPTVRKISSPKKKTIRLNWSKDFKDIDGYQVQYSVYKNFKKKKTVTVKGKNNTKKTISKLKSKKRYYVRVRAYINQGNGEKAYSKWSKAKSIKVK